MKRMILSTLLTWTALAGAAMAENTPLPSLGADLAQTSVSGLGAGGFMAAQLAVAYSSRIVGVGVIGGGPFYCAGTYQSGSLIEIAQTTCMTPFSSAVGANGAVSYQNARRFAVDGRIDPTGNLQRQRVYAATGGLDDTVKSMVVEQVAEFYRLAGAPAASIRYVFSRETGHGISTDNPDDPPCGATGMPYMNNCGFVQAHDVLRHLYPERTGAVDSSARGMLIRFDQSEFLNNPRSSMDDEAYVYVPDACRDGGCAVHVAFHGCRQGASEVGSRFYRGAGYNGFADANRLIVLYPQVHVSKGIPFNPRGCWDFWGYSNGHQPDWTFATRQAPQMQAVMAMIERLGRK